MKIAYLIVPMMLAMSLQPVAAAEADVATASFSSFDTFNSVCGEISDYDALHAANLAKGWEYLGTEESSSALGAIMASSLAKTPAPNPQVEKIMPVLGSIMQSMFTYGQHRRIYRQQLADRTLVLKQSYRPAVEGSYEAQVGCVLYADAPEGLPSNEELIAKVGAKPDSKTNYERKAGKPVELEWRTTTSRRSFSFIPPRTPIDRGAAAIDHAGVVKYSKFLLTDKVPAEGDPEVSPNPADAAAQTAEGNAKADTPNSSL